MGQLWYILILTGVLMIFSIPVIPIYPIPLLMWICSLFLLFDSFTSSNIFTSLFYVFLYSIPLVSYFYLAIYLTLKLLNHLQSRNLFLFLSLFLLSLISIQLILIFWLFLLMSFFEFFFEFDLSGMLIQDLRYEVFLHQSKLIILFLFLWIGPYLYIIKNKNEFLIYQKSKSFFSFLIFIQFFSWILFSTLGLVRSNIYQYLDPFLYTVCSTAIILILTGLHLKFFKTSNA